MKVFYIDKPYVSSGLKRTYHKKLEVFEGEAEVYDTNVPGKWLSIKQVVYVYTYRKSKGWVRKNNTTRIHHYFQTKDIATNVSMSDKAVYTTFEAAAASKLLLIQRMSREYEANIKKLQELYNRNVPATQHLLDEFLEEYPDIFI